MHRRGSKGICACGPPPRLSGGGLRELRAVLWSFVCYSFLLKQTKPCLHFCCLIYVFINLHVLFIGCFLRELRAARVSLAICREAVDLRLRERKQRCFLRGKSGALHPTTFFTRRVYYLIISGPASPLSEPLACPAAYSAEGGAVGLGCSGLG